VDRHIDSPCGENRDIGGQPLEGVLGEKADPVAWLDAPFGESCGGSVCLRAVLRPSQIMVETVTLVSESPTGPEAFGDFAVHGGKVWCGHGDSLGRD
jgi:hypothetical protein